MPIKESFNIGSVKNKLLNSAESQVRSMALRVFNNVKLFSPVRTGTYFRQHRFRGVMRVGSQVIGTVENIGEYPERVEQGFRSTPVNWNLVNLGQLYYAVGASPYKKAILKSREYFYSKK